MAASTSFSSLVLIILVLHARAATPIHSGEEGTDELFRMYHVHVINDMTIATGEHPSIDICCWSDDDRLGKRTLYYRQEYLIRFHIDLFRLTRFLCFMTWSPNELQFEAFNAVRDESRCHKGTCYWAIRPDGVYFSRDNATWGREYQWRSPPPPPPSSRMLMNSFDSINAGTNDRYFCNPKMY